MFVKLFILLLTFLLSVWAQSENSTPIGIYEKQGQHLPLNLSFTNSKNQQVQLSQLVKNTPFILTFNYFNCPGICSPQLTGLATVLNKMQLEPNKDYQVITISIAADDNSAEALKKKRAFINIVKSKQGINEAWHFLVGKQSAIDAISDAAGYKYQKRVNQEGVVDYLHPGAILTVSADGKIARYLNGIKYSPFDLKLALIEASEGRVGPTIAKTLLYCFAYDAQSKTYVFQAEKIIGALIFLIVLGFFIYLVKSGRKKEGGDGNVS